MAGVFFLTIKEMLSKKIFVTVFILATVVCVLIIFALNIKVGGVDSKMLFSLFGQQIKNEGNSSFLSPEQLLGYIQTGISVAIFFISLFVSLFATSGIFPDFLKKGSIDLILSKPLSRKNIFLQRSLGALLMVTINIFYIILFSWVILSVKFDIWNPGFLLSGLVIVLFFFILFSFMTLFAVVTKNMVISLILTYFIIFILSPIIAAVNRFGIISGSFYKDIIGALHAVLPKVSETVMIIKGIVMSESYSAAPLWTSLSTGLIVFISAMYIFERRDF